MERKRAEASAVSGVGEGWNGRFQMGLGSCGALSKIAASRTDYVQTGWGIAPDPDGLASGRVPGMHGQVIRDVLPPADGSEVHRVLAWRQRRQQQPIPARTTPACGVPVMPPDALAAIPVQDARWSLLRRMRRIIPRRLSVAHKMRQYSRSRWCRRFPFSRGQSKIRSPMPRWYGRRVRQQALTRLRSPVGLERVRPPCGGRTFSKHGAKNRAG